MIYLTDLLFKYTEVQVFAGRSLPWEGETTLWEGAEEGLKHGLADFGNI